MPLQQQQKAELAGALLESAQGLQDAAPLDTVRLEVAARKDRTPFQEAFWLGWPLPLQQAAARAVVYVQRLSNKGLLALADTEIQLAAAADRALFATDWVTMPGLWQLCQERLHALGALGEPVAWDLQPREILFLTKVYELFESSACIILTAADHATRCVRAAERRFSDNASRRTQKVAALSQALGGLLACLEKADHAANWPAWARAAQDGVSLEGAMPSVHMAVSHLQLATGWLHIKVRPAMQAVAAALSALLPRVHAGGLDADIEAWLDPGRQHANPVLHAVLGLQPKLSVQVKGQLVAGHQVVAIALAALGRTPQAVVQQHQAAGPPLPADQDAQLVCLKTFHYWARVFSAPAAVRGEPCFTSGNDQWPTLSDWVEDWWKPELPMPWPAYKNSTELLVARQLIAANGPAIRELERLWVGAVGSKLGQEAFTILVEDAAADAPTRNTIYGWWAAFGGLQLQHPQGVLVWAACNGAYVARQQRQLLALCHKPGATAVAQLLLVAAFLLTMQVLKAVRLLDSPTVPQLMVELRHAIGCAGLPDVDTWQGLLVAVTRPVFAPAWLAGFPDDRLGLDPEVNAAELHAAQAAPVVRRVPLLLPGAERAVKVSAAAAAAGGVPPEVARARALDWASAEKFSDLAAKWLTQHAEDSPWAAGMKKLYSSVMALPLSQNFTAVFWPLVLTHRWAQPLDRVQLPGPVVGGVRSLAWGAVIQQIPIQLVNAAGQQVVVAAAAEEVPPAEVAEPIMVEQAVAAVEVPPGFEGRLQVAVPQQPPALNPPPRAGGGGEPAGRGRPDLPPGFGGIVSRPQQQPQQQQPGSPARPAARSVHDRLGDAGRQRAVPAERGPRGLPADLRRRMRSVVVQPPQAEVAAPPSPGSVAGSDSSGGSGSAASSNSSGGEDQRPRHMSRHARRQKRQRRGGGDDVR